ncbi:hypothetical protein BH20CHL6_BH20CHL6_10840 [soil metagenome]
MAHRALPAGTVRRRTMFGLLDADGWTAALLQGLFWFVLIIFVLGYVPDRVYYFTVLPTVDVGFNVISPINFCPAPNRDLPCPAPAGAVVPWDESPLELTLPEPRTGQAAVQSGTYMYLLGGEIGGTATAAVLQTRTNPEDGNIDLWAEGPALPAPRADAAAISFAGVPYVMGGTDEAGEPTDTVFEGVLEEGLLTGWQARDDMRLPVPVTAAAAVASPNGLFLMGGAGADGSLMSTVYHSILDQEGRTPTLGAWQERPELALPEPRARTLALSIGNFMYVVGGEGPNGPTNQVYRLQLDPRGQPATDEVTGQMLAWAISLGEQSLPEPRVDAAGFVASGNLYVVGGLDANGAPVNTVYWTVPDALGGDLLEWRVLEATNLPAPRADASVVPVGSYAYLAGGADAEGPTDTLFRSDLAPELPFFRLGMFGATIPALGIEGEIGQQLGYLNAAGVGGVNFVLLILVGLAFSHRRRTRAVLSRFSRGRISPPRDEDHAV